MLCAEGVGSLRVAATHPHFFLHNRDRHVQPAICRKPHETKQDLFRIRDHVVDFEDFVSEYRERSARRSSPAGPAQHRLWLGPRRKTRSLFSRSRTGRAPIHLFVHGGYWRAFSKDDYAFVADSDHCLRRHRSNHGLFIDARAPAWRFWSSRCSAPPNGLPIMRELRRR